MVCLSLTKDELYDLYDGSLESKLVSKMSKDVFDIWDKLPHDAVSVLTDKAIERKSDELSDKLIELDGGDLGIRKEVLALGLEEKYLELRNELQLVGSDATKASMEFFKKVLGLAPKEVILLGLNAGTAARKSEYILGLLSSMVETEDKQYTEGLYILTNLLLPYEEGLVLFGESVDLLVDRLSLLNEFILETRYYQPETLNYAIESNLIGDVKRDNIRKFNYKKYLMGATVNNIYLKYLDEIKPMKVTKALNKLWEDSRVLDLVDSDVKHRQTFDSGKYLALSGKTLLFRDGLTVIYDNGEFTHYPSSKVTSKILGRCCG